MIIDQLFENNKKPLNEVDPRNFDSDEDYYAAVNAPAKRRSAPSDYPYSQEQDDDYFREIFRKKREAAKKAEQDKEQGVAEEQVYESFYKVGRMLVERKMSEKEILDVFAQAEQGMTNKDTGANRTMLGRGKDVTGKAVTSVKDSINKVLDSIQNSTPVAGVDVAYDQATDALANALGPNSKVMDSIKKYRLLAKEYPKTQLFVKTALIALAGLATGGAGLPIIAGLTAAVDSAIKGEKLSSIIGKGAGAGLMAMGAQEVNSMLSGADSAATTDAGQSQDFQLPDADAAMNTQADIAAAQDWINADEAGKTAIEQTTGMSGAQLQDIAVSNDLKPGGEIAAPSGSATGAEGFGGGTYTVQADDQGGFIAQANGISYPDLKGLNPQVTNWNKLPIGTELQLPPANTHTGSVWDGSATGGTPAASTTSATTTPVDATTAAPTATAPDTATTAQPGTKFRNPFGYGYNGTTIANMPVIPGQPLNATQMAVADMSIQSGNQLSPVIQAAYDLAKRGAVKESVRFKTLPAEQMIDQKLTVLSWALNESVNRKENQSVHLTNKGVYTVFENVDRYRKAIVEYTQPGREQIPNLLRPDAPGAPLAAPDAQAAQPGMIGKGLNWLNKKAGEIGGALSTAGRQFTTGVTKEKLKMNWHQAGKPTDSDQLAAWLVTQKVPQDVVTSVFSKMGIPYTAPATAATTDATAATGSQAATSRIKPGSINLATGKPYTAAQIAAHNAAATTTAAAATSADSTATTGAADTNAAPAVTKTAPAASKFPGEDPTGPNYVGRREVARRQAARDAEAAKKPAAPNFAQQGGGYAQVNQPITVKYTGMPGAAKPAATPATTTAKLPAGGGAGVKAAAATPAASAGTRVTAGGPTPAERAALDKRIAAAAAQPVAETVKQVKRMMETVTTKAEVQRIKDYIDYHMGTNLTEGAKLKRNRLLSEVTHLAAVRRREIARRMA